MLRDAELDYMFTGAVAVSYYGRPRTTVDIDIVVRLTEENISNLAAQLNKGGIKADQHHIREAFNSDYRIVTLEDRKTPFTVDIILSTKKLDKRPGTILGLSTFYQTPQSLILSKLRMIKATRPRERRVKDRDDVRAILRYTEVNMENLKRRARRENTLSILEEITTSQNRMKHTSTNDQNSNLTPA